MGSSPIIRFLIMPQFDKVTFLTQIHWLLITFFTLYYLLLIYTPNLITLLKLRKKRLMYYNILSEKAEELNESNIGAFSLLINKISNFSKIIITKNNSALQAWTSNYINNIFGSTIKLLSLHSYGVILTLKHSFKQSL